MSKRQSFASTAAFVAALFLASAAAYADDGGLSVSVAGDLVGEYGWDKRAGGSAGTSRRLDPREAELLLYAPIDQTFDGQLSMAAHREPDRFDFSLHEMWVQTSKLIPRSRIRVGQFFLGVGRLNQVHRHDWPFISAPKVHREFFGGSHGAFDSGAEYGWLAPTPFYLDVIAGVTNGWVFGHAHGVGTQPLFPTHYLRLVTYQELGSATGLQTGLNYLGRRDSQRVWTTLLGIDTTLKWREGPLMRFLLQGEAWHRELSQVGGDTAKTLGAYVFPQYALSDTVFLGMRFDLFYEYNMRPNALEWSVVPTITYRSSEFVNFRASFTATQGQSGTKTISEARIAEVQAVFLLGSHPAHDF